MSIPALQSLRSQSTVRWMGLMSGTSCDGIDVAVIDVTETAAGVPRIDLVNGDVEPFPADFAAELRNALDQPDRLTAEMVATWDRRLGDAFAQSASHAIERWGKVDAIAVSGHTFAHRPDLGATLQVGNPSIVSARCGVPVVGAFRTNDVANGGEGAPLVPVGDRAMFASDEQPVAVINLGGIANVTWLPNRHADPSARDAGPANLILNGFWHRAGREGFDVDGACAASGRVHRETVERWMGHPFLRSQEGQGPRSTGREEFGEGWLETHRSDWEPLSLEDRLATAAAWIAQCVADTVHAFDPEANPRVLVGGGGAHHAELMRQLTSHFENRPEPMTRDAHGMTADLREAAAFAILGHERLHDRPGAFPSTTGCRAASPIGAWY